MRRCKKCGDEKSITEFSKDASRASGVQTYCKACCATHRKKRSDSYSKEKRNLYNREYRASLSSWFQEIKASLFCRMCGEAHQSCLDFHHTDPSTKENTISNMVCDCKPKETILLELSKCIVLCSNCHRKFHARALDLDLDLG